MARVRKRKKPMALPPLIDPAVILLVFPGGHPRQPVPVLQVPADCADNPFGKRGLRPPAKLVADFCRVNPVAEIMAFPVRDKSDQVLGDPGIHMLPEIADDCFYHREVGPFIMPARSEEHTSELQSRPHLVCRLL